MPILEIFSYIQAAVKKGKTREEISRELILKGWKEDDVFHAIASLDFQKNRSKPPSVNLVQKKCRLRDKKSVFFALVVFFGCLVSYFFVLDILFVKDTGTIDDKNMAPGKFVMESVQNGYSDMAFFESYPVALEDAEFADSAVFRPEEWNKNRVVEILGKYEKQLAVFEAGAEKKYFQPETDSLPFVRKSIDPLLMITRIEMLRSAYLAGAGRSTEAMTAALAAVKRTQAAVSSYWPSSEHKKILDEQNKIWQFFLILVKHTGDAGALKNAKNIVRSLDKHTQSAQEAVKMEYLVQVAAVDEAKKNKKIMENYIWFYRSIWAKMIFRPRLYFSQNETKKIILTEKERQLGELNKACSETVFTDEAYALIPFWKGILKKNYLGDALAKNLLQDSFAINKSRCKNLAYGALAEAGILYRIKFLENGSTWDKADEFMQNEHEYILDPYSGQKLIFNKTRKLVYSVGLDRTDDGGDETKDIVFRFEW